jgi:hypothetical protein
MCVSYHIKASLPKAQEASHVPVFLGPYHLYDAGIDDHSSAGQAGYSGSVEFSPLHSHTIPGGEGDGVCLSMHNVGAGLENRAVMLML